MSFLRPRNTANRIKIGDLQGLLIQESFTDQKTGEERTFGRLQLKNGCIISRIRIMGIITNKTEGTKGNFIQCHCEDGSGAILLKSWSNLLKNIKEGQMVEIVGTLRSSRSDEGDTQWFVQPEVISPVIRYHRELIHRLEIFRPIPEKIPNGVEISFPSITDLKNNLEELIRSLDKDKKGVTYAELRSKYPNVTENEFEDAIFELLMNGKISEPRPERYRYIED